MSHDQSYILFAGQREWQVCADSGGEVRSASIAVAEKTSDETAALLADALQREVYRGQSVLLALPSIWCHPASISIAEIPRRNRTAMLYRMEERLPFAAEGIVADFIASADETSALGVCCHLEIIQPILRALESHDINVQSIAPADLLAAQRLLPPQIAEDQIILLDDCEVGGQVNLLAFSGGRLVAWSRSSNSNLKLNLDLLAAEFSPPRVRAVDAAGKLAEFDVEKACALPASQSIARTAAARAACDVLLGRQQPWIELRRGPLAAADSLRRHRTPLNALLASVVVLLLAASAAMGLRAVRYNRLEASYRRQLEDRFRQQFPGWAISSNLKVIIESEHRKAAGAASAALPSEARKNAMSTLLDVLGRLPPQEHFTAQRLSFDEDWFEMQGEVGSFEQLDAIASAVRQSGMEVRAPEARRTPGGSWSFVLRGTRTAVAAAKAGP